MRQNSITHSAARRPALEEPILSDKVVTPKLPNGKCKRPRGIRVLGTLMSTVQSTHVWTRGPLLHNETMCHTSDPTVASRLQEQYHTSAVMCSLQLGYLISPLQCKFFSPTKPKPIEKIIKSSRQAGRRDVSVLRYYTVVGQNNV